MGKHFNTQHLKHAYKVYESKMYGWDHEDMDLFWSGVIAYFHQLLPTNYSQSYCQGLRKVLKGETIKRKCIYGGTNEQPYCLPSPGALSEYMLVTKVTKAKDKAFAKIMGNLVHEPKQNHCIIC